MTSKTIVMTMKTMVKTIKTISMTSKTIVMTMKTIVMTMTTMVKTIKTTRRDGGHVFDARSVYISFNYCLLFEFSCSYYGEDY